MEKKGQSGIRYAGGNLQFYFICSRKHEKVSFLISSTEEIWPPLFMLFKIETLVSMNPLSIRWHKRTLRRHGLFFVAVLLVGFFLVSVFIIHNYEKKANPDLSFLDTLRNSLVFSLGEYGESPKTNVGTAISVLLFVFGIVVIAAIIGKVASIFVNLKMEVKMPKELESHIVVCNWNDRADRIIKEIHSPLGRPETEIIVITETDMNEKELRLSPEYEKVYFIKSDPTLHDVLKRARAHLARGVIILADMECSDPDAKTVLIALAITKLERELLQKPHIVAEVINHHKIQHLLDAGVDEWVCSADYGLGIIAQCALYGKLSEVYQQLLTYSKETNEIYLVDSNKYPQNFLGKSFKEVSGILNDNNNSENPAILLGVKRDDRVILNPRAKEFDEFKKGDSLIVMSFDQPDLTYLKSK